MSLLSLTSLINIRKKEMDNRINSLRDECEKATCNLNNLLNYAESFLCMLDCDLPTLKNRYLNYMQYLDEYIYTITDFNIAVEKMDIPENCALFDSFLNRSISATLGELSILDMTPETLRISSHRIHKSNITEVPNNISVGKLICISSNSASSDNVTEIKEDEEEVRQEELEGTLGRNEGRSVEQERQSDHCNLPAQVLLENDDRISCTITNVDNPGFFHIISNDSNEIEDLHRDMVVYYNRNRINFVNKEAFVHLNLTYCAGLDANAWYRCLVMNYDHSEEEIELYSVDFGHKMAISYKLLQPLPEHFFIKPAFARVCHLAGIVPPLGQNGIWSLEATQFVSNLPGQGLIAIIDDNSSESLSITLINEEDVIINHEMVKLELAIEIGNVCDSLVHARKERYREQYEKYENRTEEYPDSDENPEYENVLEAVQGYSSRDEADICRHYKGPPHTTCFKAVCKKKHIVIHPDGWTRDREEVLGAAINDLDLPEPGSKVRVIVTHISSCKQVWIQFVQVVLQKEQHSADNRRWPSRTLAHLTAEMNGATARDAHRRFHTLPAITQLVAALYPADQNWYRALILEHNVEERSIKVRYVDYGNCCWIPERDVRELDLAYAVLPFQAVRVRLASIGVHYAFEGWDAAHQLVQEITLNKMFTALIVSTEAEAECEMSVVLFDEHGFDIAEYVATMDMVEVIPYSIQENRSDTLNGVRFIPG